MQNLEQISKIISNPDERDITILKIARQEFAQNGYHMTNMDQIAHKANIGKGTLYRRFFSKQALFFGLLEWSTKLFNQSVEKINKALPIKEQIKKYLACMTEFMLDNSDIIKIIAHEQSKIMESIHSEMHKRLIKLHKDSGRFWDELIFNNNNSNKFAANLELETIKALLFNISKSIYSDLIIFNIPLTRNILEKRNNALLEILCNGIFKK